MANSFKYTTAIDKIRKLKQKKKVIQGGTSASKTYSILAILIDKACRNEGIRISIVSQSIPHLRRGAINDFLNILKVTRRFIPDHWNRTLLKYTFANQSYIEFFSADDPTKMFGSRRDILYCNECNHISFISYHELATRTDGARYDGIGEIYLDYNPTHRFWAMTEVLTEDDAELLILTYKDNEAISQATLKMFEQNMLKSLTSDYWKNWCRIHCEGLVGTLEGTIFTNWNEVDEIPSNATYVGTGLDFGYNDPTAAVAVYKLNNELYLDEIIYQKGLLNSDIANILKASKLGGLIYADSAEPKSISELQRYSLSVLPVSKGPDSIRFGINILQEYKINVTKRSKNLKDELSKYSWVKDKEGNSLNVPQDINNHAIDAVRYVAMMRLKHNQSTGLLID